MYNGSRSSSFDCHADHILAAGWRVTAKLIQPLSSVISPSWSADSACSVGVRRHRPRRWIVVTCVTSRLSEPWNRSASSPARSESIHFTLVQAVFGSATYTSL
jgi:hypothetical protein